MRSTVSPRALRHVRAFSSTARRLDTYGFIGLGQMGYQMARNLQSKLPPSDTVRLFDINRGAMQKLAAEMKTSQIGGAAVELADSAEAASTEAANLVIQDTVITVLPEPSHVKSVYASIISHLQSKPPTTATGTGGQPQPRRLFIDCSTIDPASSREVAALVAEGTSGAAAFVDAPMSGGVVGATAGTLTFMLGAPGNLVSRRTDAAHHGPAGAAL
ncbi:hypothetical protein MAPG_00471, partial [Magnaporthiopsis poae ATCC 64411]